MSKGILDHSSEETYVYKSTVGRVVLLTGAILGGLLFGMEWGLDALNLPGNLARQIWLGLFLLLVWLLVSSGIRAVNKLLPGIAVGWLFISGMGTGLMGQAILSLAQWLIPRITGEGSFPLIAYLAPGLLPILAVSLLVAVLTMITLRVKDKLSATLLRLLIFGLLALFIYLKL